MTGNFLSGSSAGPKTGLTGAFVRNVVHPLWASRTHPAYARYSREFERNQFLDPEELRKLQMQRLRQQLVYAFRYVPFYRLRMTEAGLTPLDIQTHEDLRLLPVLTKRDILDHQDLLVSSDVPASRRVRNQTGGSTGSPVQFFVDKERSDSRMASTARHDGWAGLRPGDWYAHLWGSRYESTDTPDPRPGWRQKLLHRNLTLHPAALSDESMWQFVEVLRTYRPRHLVAYARSAALFAEFCRTNQVRDIAFASMIVSAEMLQPGQRSALESTFGGKVFNRYGCSEVSVIASECEFHSGMHTNADALLVEVEAAPHLPAGTGRVLVTDLLNRSMPLLRYEVGDLASLAPDGQCPCGRSLPLMGNIQGRLSDVLHWSSGRMVAIPPLARLAADMREVRQVQFLQPDPQHVTLKVVAGTGYCDHTEKELQQRMQPHFQGQANLTIVTADSIPPDNSEKHKFSKKSDEQVAISTAI
jgi:phenylacetate-CoA ligase